MTTFYLARHAHAEWTLDENRPLSAQGFEDAKRVADVLQAVSHPRNLLQPSAASLSDNLPLAERLGTPIEIEADLRERKLGNEVFEDFFGAVEATWQDPSFAHPGGESSAEAQSRGLALVKRLQAKSPNEAIVLSTHGNLMALVLQAFDPSINFAFWKSLSMPDIYLLKFSSSNKVELTRLWQEVQNGF